MHDGWVSKFVKRPRQCAWDSSGGTGRLPAWRARLQVLRVGHAVRDDGALQRHHGARLAQRGAHLVAQHHALRTACACMLRRMGAGSLRASLHACMRKASVGDGNRYFSMPQGTSGASGARRCMQGGEDTLPAAAATSSACSALTMSACAGSKVAFPAPKAPVSCPARLLMRRFQACPSPSAPSKA